ncbi:universal stress protein [Actinacidiphila glaucinigra]|uniref:universal stress protein n=1 Tax=Actinacidiphila glaucinigra TaxID=235986 RepID=UPI003D8D3A5C
MEGPSQQRVVVGVNGSPNSLVALQRAGAEARLSGRRLLAVLVWTRTGAGSRAPNPGPVPHTARSAATRLLTAVLNDVFAATAGDLHVDGLTIAGRSAGETLVRIAQRDGDLLVVGAGRRRRRGRGPWRSPVARHCLAHASCPVLTVPPSPLQLDLEAMTRRRGLRRAGRDDVRREGSGP